MVAVPSKREDKKREINADYKFASLIRLLNYLYNLLKSVIDAGLIDCRLNN
jgi:hypothetical protein